MLHATVGIFGNAEASSKMAKQLGKKGTENDLVIYNHGSSEGVFTYVTVKSEKIQSLLQAVNMIDIPVLVIDEIDAALGEQIIAINERGFEKGFVILQDVAEDQIKPLIKGTCVEPFAVVKDKIELVEEIKKTKIRREDSLMIPIDNYFDVKGVGTVVLGIIKSSRIKKYDKIMMEPIGKEIMIKGIQSQDKALEEAEEGTRVGLNLKGIDTDEMKRGFVIGEMKKAKKLQLKIEKNKYSDEVKEGEDIFVCSGLQVITASMKPIDDSGSMIEVELDSEIAYRDDTRFLIATGKQKMPRIIGHGFV